MELKIDHAPAPAGFPGFDFSIRATDHTDRIARVAISLDGMEIENMSCPEACSVADLVLTGQGTASFGSRHRLEVTVISCKSLTTRAVRVWNDR